MSDFHHRSTYDSGKLAKNIHVSIVSHGQAALVHLLLKDLTTIAFKDNFRVTLTLNIPENLSFQPEHFPYPIQIKRNEEPKGFGANHNFAFTEYQNNSDYFCIINPDVRLKTSLFPELLNEFELSKLGVVGPLVVDDQGNIEDSARSFPTPFKILRKIFSKHQSIDYQIGSEPIYPDWIAGMFMLFPSHVFKQLNGFNEKYFLYYEDVEICARLKLSGYLIALIPTTKIIHCAQRTSHKNFKYLKWHITSMLRFFCSKSFFKLQRIKSK